MRAQRRTWSRYLWLAPVLVFGLASCSTAGQPVVPSLQELTPDQDRQVSVVREQFKAAEAKGTWDKDDERKFAANIAALPPGARLQLKEDLIERLNTRKLRPFRRQPSGPVVCTTLCDAASKSSVADSAPPAASSVVPEQPVAQQVAPAEPAQPATPSKPPTRVVGKAAAK